jgi:hypothetical protein
MIEHGKLFTDRNINYIIEMMLSCAEHGLGNVQFNVVDNRHADRCAEASGALQEPRGLRSRLQPAVLSFVPRAAA